jgi:hypothetical protein
MVKDSAAHCNVVFFPPIIVPLVILVMWITISFIWMGNLVCKWHASDKPSLSDHRYIFFQISNMAITRFIFRDPPRTNWESYKDKGKS